MPQCRCLFPCAIRTVTNQPIVSLGASVWPVLPVPPRLVHLRWAGCRLRRWVGWLPIGSSDNDNDIIHVHARHLKC